MDNFLVVWIAVVATAAIIVFGVVVPSLFIRSRPRQPRYRRATRSNRVWAELAVFTIALLFVFLASVILTDRLTTLLTGYWAWSVPLFFFLAAIFVGWFFTNAGYRGGSSVLSGLLVLGFVAGFVAYMVQPIPWPSGYPVIP